MALPGRPGGNQKRNPCHQLPVFINLLKLQISPYNIVHRHNSVFADGLVFVGKDARQSPAAIRTRPDLRQKFSVRPDFPAALSGVAERIMIS